jgi:hypothetical protein
VGYWGGWTQGLVLARQALYHLSHSASPHYELSYHSSYKR